MIIILYLFVVGMVALGCRLGTEMLQFDRGHMHSMKLYMSKHFEKELHSLSIETMCLCTYSASAASQFFFDYHCFLNCDGFFLPHF